MYRQMSNPLKKKILQYINDNQIYKGVFQLPKDQLPQVHALLQGFSMYAITTEGGVGTDSSEHMHFFFVAPYNFNNSTFKKKIRSTFPNLKREGKGGEHKYSCGMPKVTNAKQYNNFISMQDQLFLQICYIFKDCIYDPISDSILDSILINLTKDDALYLQEEYHNIKKQNIDLKIKQQSNNNNERQSIVKLLLDQLKSEFSSIDATGGKHFMLPGMNVIIKFVCRHFIKSHKTMNKNVIINITETILNILSEEFFENYVNDIENKILL